MDTIKRHTLAILVDNEAGVLSQVTRLFSRKGYNIESITVIRHGKVRRAKLYYLRDRVGKAAKVKERI